MQTLLLGTGNPHKVVEIEGLVAELPVQVRSARDVAIPDVVEDADTFVGNAAKKATEIAAATGLLTLADDSGLCVDALDGAPGVFSARYAGPECDYAANNAKLLRALEGVDDRGARFVTVVALARPDGLLWTVEGVTEGVITRAARGEGGFGYDPLFQADEAPDGRTYAELTLPEKNAISHRGKALRAFAARFAEWLATRPS